MRSDHEDDLDPSDDRHPAKGRAAAGRRRLIEPWQAVALLSGLLGLAAVRSALSTLAVGSQVRSPTPSGRAAPGRGATARPGPAPIDPARQARVALGRKIFFDPGFSQPPGTSCASCHDPAHGFAGNNGSPIGVARGSRPDHFARRSTPSVMYLKFVPRFHFHWEEDAALPDAVGGFFWDGRADSIAALVEQPLTNHDEMNGGDRARVAERLRQSRYADELRSAFGADALDSADRAQATLGAALEAFLTSDELSPFSSRYDDVLRGRATLTALEQRGLQLFRDPARGNCASCHRLNPGSSNPARSLFTDYGFESVGVPRNASLAESRGETGFDLGLCERRDARTHTDEDRLCGSFRTPSLRNVATRPSFMHNGRFVRLRDVVAFYATRSIDPARWYRAGSKFDDLPEKYREYVNEISPPYDRGPGEAPRLRDDEIDAIVAFLETLTDAGQVAASPVAPVASIGPAPPAEPSPPPAEPSPPPQRRAQNLRTQANQPQPSTP